MSNEAEILALSELHYRGSTLDPVQEDYDNLSPGRKVVPSGAWTVFKTCVLLSCFCVAAAIAVAGACLLLCIFVARTVTPPEAHFVRELYFDYTQNEAIASTSFLPDEYVGEASSQTRVFPPRQMFDVVLELEAAEIRDASGTDLFQVIGQLLSADGRIAATASRSAFIPHGSPMLRAVRGMLLWPLSVLGLWHERQLMRVPLFVRYVEKLSVPFVNFRAVLQVPHLFAARVIVDLRLGALKRLIYLVRPGTWTMIALSLVALACMASGFVGMVSVIALWAVSFGGGRASPKGATKPSQEADSDLDDDVDFVAGPASPSAPPYEPFPHNWSEGSLTPKSGMGSPVRKKVDTEFGSAERLDSKGLPLPYRRLSGKTFADMY